MKRDRIDDILRDKLHSIEPVGAVPSWFKMEQRMAGKTELSDSAKVESIAPRRQLRRWLSYSAAAVLALIFGSSLYFINYNSQDIVTTLSEVTAEEHTTPNIDLSKAVTSEMLAAVTEVRNPAVDKLFKSARHVSVVSSTPQLVQLLSGEVPIEQNLTGKPIDADPANYTEKPNGSAFSIPQTESTYDRSSAWWEDMAVKARKKSWTVGIYNNTLASSQGANARPIRTLVRYDAALVESNFTQNVQEFQANNFKHRFPISLGLNFRKNITDRIGVETGLVYTYMESVSEMTGSFNSYKYKQRLHYIGIPLALSYNIYTANNFDIYAMVGAMAEKAVSAKGVTQIFDQNSLASTIRKDLSAPGLLWSANAAIGVNYDIVNHFGIYLEPGVSYYIPNSNQPTSYRTNNPWSFNLRIGFRFKF